MKKQYLRIILLLCCITVPACKMPASPEKYFDAAALNANVVSHFGSDYFITVLGYGKRSPGTSPYNYEQQVGFAIQRVERYLENVNNLISTKDTEALLDASKDLFQFTLESYRTDHLSLAKMIDRNAPEEEIVKALEALDKKSYETFLIKYNKLHDLGIQYAKDHDIQLVEMPRFNR